jgi:hypothetical protein
MLQIALKTVNGAAFKDKRIRGLLMLQIKIYALNALLKDN